MAKVTIKQEKFCQRYIETGNASEAYRFSYAGKLNPNALAVEACRLLDSPNVSLRIEELRKSHAKRHEITLESLLFELEEARQLAMETGKAGPAVQASMGKAKLVGLDKQIIDHTSSDGTMSPKGLSLDDFYVQAKSGA